MAPSLAEGVNLVVSSLTACAIATDRLFMVLRKTPGQNDEKVSYKMCTYYLKKGKNWLRDPTEKLQINIQTRTNMGNLKKYLRRLQDKKSS